MSNLCNHCEAVRINGIRCHEKGCPNSSENINLISDGTMDTVFQCGNCGEEIRYTFDPSDETEEYDDFVFWALRDAQDTHECPEDENEYLDDEIEYFDGDEGYGTV